MSLADDIAAARRAFKEGSEQGLTPSAMKQRMEALTDLLWDNLPEIEAALRCWPSVEDRRRNSADAQTLRYCANTCSVTTHIRHRLREIADRVERGAPVPPTDTATPDDADKLRQIADRRKLGLMSWERATLEAIADKLDTRAKDPTT